MKKIYNKPETEILDIEMQQMICMSEVSYSLNPTEDDAADGATNTDDGWEWPTYGGEFE
ncbi:MAG: hypothetical protein J6B91_09635 [Prevotella sp.]|nr:hypothetical protein [Prevotella sp.]